MFPCCFFNLFISWNFVLLPSHLNYQSPSLIFTIFKGEIPLLALLGVLSLSQASYGHVCSMLLAFSYGRILKLVCILWILQNTRPSADSLSFLFPKVALQLKFVVSLWPIDPTDFLHVLTSHLPKPTRAAFGNIQES